MTDIANFERKANLAKKRIVGKLKQNEVENTNVDST